MRGNLHITSSSIGDTAVQLNGLDIGGSLTGLTLRLNAGDVPTAVLDLSIVGLSAEAADARLYIADETRELLLRFGWTAPPDDGQQVGVS